jgi:hypothetical protein
MSRIWECLRLAEQSRVGMWDRRSADRCRSRIPLLVYGYTCRGEAFHELTEATCFNAGGGLIRLRTDVIGGQRLLLFNRMNDKEQECRVIGRRLQVSDHAIAVGFWQAAHDFWQKRD